MFAPIKKQVAIPQAEGERLGLLLDAWRKERWATRSSGPSLMSRRVILPDEQIQKIVDHGGDFLRVQTITVNLLKSFLQWDLASAADWQAVTDVVHQWRGGVVLPTNSPQSRGGRRKKSKKNSATVDSDLTPRRPIAPLSQPSFSPARLSSRGRGHWGRPANGRGNSIRNSTTQHVTDNDFFITSSSTPTGPSTVMIQPLNTPNPCPITAPSPSLTYSTPPYGRYPGQFYPQAVGAVAQSYSYPYPYYSQHMYSLPPQYCPTTTSTRSIPPVGPLPPQYRPTITSTRSIHPPSQAS
jgi:hypothetical protein